MDWSKTTAWRDEKHLRVGIWCVLYQKFGCTLCSSYYSQICGFNQTIMVTALSSYLHIYMEAYIQFSSYTYTCVYAYIHGQIWYMCFQIEDIFFHSMLWSSFDICLVRGLKSLRYICYNNIFIIVFYKNDTAPIYSHQIKWGPPIKIS